MDDLFEQLKAAPPVNKNIVPKYATSDDYSKNIFRDDDDTPPPKESTSPLVPVTRELCKSSNSSPPKCTRSFKVRIARIPKNWSVNIEKSVETKVTDKEILKNKSNRSKRALDPKIAKKSQQRETAINTKPLDSEQDDIKDSSNTVLDASMETLGIETTVDKNSLETTVKKKSLEKETTGNTKPVETEKSDDGAVTDEVVDKSTLETSSAASEKSENESVVNAKPVETEIADNMGSLQSISDNNKKSMEAKAVSNKKIRECAAAALKKPVEKEVGIYQNPIETGKGEYNEPIKSGENYTEKPLVTEVHVNKNPVATIVVDNNILSENETAVSTKVVKTATAANMEVLKDKSSNNRKPIGPKTALNAKGRNSAPSKKRSLEKESVVNTESIRSDEVGHGKSINSSSDDRKQSLENKTTFNKDGVEAVTLVDDSEEEVTRKPIENKVVDNMDSISNKSDCNQSSLEAKVAVKRKARETTAGINRNSLKKETVINTTPLGKEDARKERLENKSNYTEQIETKSADDMIQIESNEGEGEGVVLIDSEEIGNDGMLLEINIKSDNKNSGGVKQDMNNKTGSKTSVKSIQNLAKSESKATPTKAQQKEFSPIELSNAEKCLKPSNELATKRCLVRLARTNQWANRIKSGQELEKTPEQANNGKAYKQIKFEKTPKRKSAEGKGSQLAKRGRSSISPTKPQTTFYIKLDTSPSRTLDSKREKSPEKSRLISKGPKSKIQNKREADGLIKNFKTSPNKTKVKKFTRTQLIKTFGKRIFQLRVRIKRCRHPVMVDFDTIAQARKKSKNLSVSFRDQVEILGSTDTDDEQSDEDHLKGISKLFNSKKLDTEDSHNVAPALLISAEGSTVVDKGGCNQSFVNPNEVNTVDDISITTSTPLTCSSPSLKRKEKKSFSPLKFETTPSPKKEQLKKANEKLPPSGLRLLDIDDMEDDDDECEYIVPTELPERRKSRLNSITTESAEQLELITKAADACAKSDEQKSSESTSTEKRLIDDTVIDVTDNASDDDGEKNESVCIIEDESDTEILPKLTRIPSSPNLLITDSIPEIFSEKEKSDEEQTIAAKKDETDDIIQNILKERIDDLSLDDYGVADSAELDST